ncbi:MAG: hypothetical protein AABY01_04095, partial [Nanoarchaeota archaeon]
LANLEPHARSVLIVELPDLGPKGDLSDWIGAGRTREDLEALVHPPPLDPVRSSWEPIDLRPVLSGDKPDARPTVLLRSAGPAGLYAVKVNVIGGEPDSGKSMIAMEACRQEIESGNLVVYIDYEDDEAALFLAQADYDLAQQRAGRRTTVIRQRYLNGLIDEATAINQLGDVQKPPEEIEELITLWREQREDRIERPTPAQLLGFYRDRVISGPDLAAELTLAGYEDRYVTWYIAQADADIAEAEARKSEAENRETLQRAPIPTRGDLANWLRRGIITEDEFYARLQAQGYQDADIRAYATAVRLPVTLPFFGSPEGRVRTLEAKESFRRGLLTGAELRLTLQGLGYPAELADAIADYEELRIGA